MSDQAPVIRNPLRRYLRPGLLPTIFCTGCGGGTVLNCFCRAVDELGLEPRRMVMVTGIGCSSWIPSPYFLADTLHTTHGRAIAFATGVRIAQPEMKVVVIAGDGDIAGIGGNHLIHAARRNLDLTVIMVNNAIYGMTGGQVAPTTPPGVRTTTTPHGNVEPAFDVASLVAAAGASFVGRWTTYHVFDLVKAFKAALEHRGFSFVEVVGQCTTSYAKAVGMRGAADFLADYKQRSLRLAAAARMKPEEVAGRILVGTLRRASQPEFCERLYAQVAAVSGESSSEATAALASKPAPLLPGPARQPRPTVTVRLAGFGGQGIVKAAEILAAAAVADGQQALQNQSYGSSARGGLCTADVVISDAAIHEIEPDQFDVLVTLSQDSCRAFLGQLRPAGTLIYEQDLVQLPAQVAAVYHGLPATRIAAQEVGRRIVTNIVVLGFLAAVTRVVGRAALEQTIRRNVPAGSEELNLRAFAEGWRRGEALLGAPAASRGSSSG
jgi:2-oxoglutarate ferredoxin oxidoreductase subunit beta